MQRQAGAMLMAAALGGACAAACGGAGGGPSPAPPGATTGVTAAPDPGAAAPSEPEGPAEDTASCGALECRVYDSPEAAFSAVLATEPKILAIGEAHAQKGTEGVESTAKRFTERFLPMLKGKATDLVVELWVADKSCAAPKVAAVAEQQKPVTTGQAGGNQNEFVALGHASKAAGITPHILRPTCDEYDRILAAGDDAVLEMLAMITRLTSEKVQKLMKGPSGGSPSPLVVAYGGAMHNDLSPKEGREDWSFGPELMDRSGGKYVELDLIVPEYIKDNDTWRALPWYAHYDATKHADKTLLFKPAPGTYVLVFPRQAE